MSVVDGISVISAVVSLLLALFALWLGHKYYVATNAAEVRVTGILAKIDASTKTLERITAKHLDRLTGIIERQISPTRQQEENAASLPEPAEGPVGSLLPPRQPESPKPQSNDGQSVNVIRGHGIPGVVDPYPVDKFRTDYVTVLFALYYYTVYANYVAGVVLPPLNEFNESSDFDRKVRDLINLSSSDFHIVANQLDTIAKASPELLSKHHLFQLGQLAKPISGLVVNATQRFQQLEKLHADQGGPSRGA